MDAFRRNERHPLEELDASLAAIEIAHGPRRPRRAPT